MTAPIRVEPATTTVHLEYNAGEDMNVVLSVVDAAGDLAPIIEAKAQIRSPRGVLLHEWSAAQANITVTTGSVVLITTAANTTAWYATWRDAEWDMQVVDLAGKTQIVSEGSVKVRRACTQ